MKLLLALTVLWPLTCATAASFDGQVEDWKKDQRERFSDPEANFKLVMKRLRENYFDPDLSEEQLYRAATAGMLASLNSGKESENWNVLFSPRMLEDFVIEKTGKLTGIGTTLEFDPKTGYAHVLAVLPHSAALKAGLRQGDQILSVNGQRYKGKSLPDMVAVIRGPAGESVDLKVLREDRVLNVRIKRDVVSFTEVDSKMLDPQTALLTIGFFKEGTGKIVQQTLAKLNGDKLKRLVIDLRGNTGGTFDDAVKVGELFLPQGAVIVRTVSRGKEAQEYKAPGGAWGPHVQLAVLTDESTASGAELLTAALKEGRHALVVGGTTRGKWNVQSIEDLPNQFAIKYSVAKFESASGESYEGKGLKPDLEIEGPKGALLGEIQKESDSTKRLKQDPPLKAAVQVSAAH